MREENKQAEMEGVNPYQTILRQKKDFDLKISNLKAAMIVIEKQTGTFIMSRARKFVHEATDFVVKILQEEMLMMLR